MIPLAAAVALLLSAPAAAVPATAPEAYRQALVKARQSFLAQQPGQPTLDAAVKLPPQTDPRQASNDAAIRTAVDAAKDVQLGCQAPCSAPADVQVYSGKVELIARRLGMKDDAVAAALQHYIPAGKPRLRTAAGDAKNPAAQAMEAEVVARLLADQKLAPAIRASLNQRALAIAAALGTTAELKADANGVVSLPDGRQARLTAAQLAQLNRIPQTQARILRNLATNPPPPPMTAQQRQDKVLADADREIAANPGLIGDTYNYWDNEAKDPNSSWLWSGYAKLNKGLLTFSGLKAVEESSARLGYVWDNPDVSKGEKFWLGTKLGANMGLSFVSFLPAAAVANELTTSVKVGVAAAAETGSVLSGVKTGLTAAKDGFYWIGKGGAAVPGMVRAAPEAAEAMTSAGKNLTQVILKAVPDGAKVTTDQLRTLIGGLNEFGARYGIKVVEGGTAGESVASGGTIYVSLKAGAQHEMVHVVQQTYTRVLALEQIAARSGTTVEGLSAAQRAEGFATAAKWETGSYAQLESQAYRATGFMGGSGGAQYTRNLLLSGQEVTAGMRNGEVLDGSFSAGQRFYGRLTQWVGHSQGEIGGGMGATAAVLSQTPMFDPARQLADEFVQPHVAPAQ